MRQFFLTAPFKKMVEMVEQDFVGAGKPVKHLKDGVKAVFIVTGF